MAKNKPEDGANGSAKPAKKVKRVMIQTPPPTLPIDHTIADTPGLNTLGVITRQTLLEKQNELRAKERQREKEKASEKAEGQEPDPGSKRKAGAQGGRNKSHKIRKSGDNEAGPAPMDTDTPRPISAPAAAHAPATANPHQSDDDDKEGSPIEKPASKPREKMTKADEDRAGSANGHSTSSNVAPAAMEAGDSKQQPTKSARQKRTAEEQDAAAEQHPAAKKSAIEPEQQESASLGSRLTGLFNTARAAVRLPLRAPEHTNGLDSATLGQGLSTAQASPITTQGDDSVLRRRLFDTGSPHSMQLRTHNAAASPTQTHRTRTPPHSAANHTSLEIPGDTSANQQNKNAGERAREINERRRATNNLIIYAFAFFVIAFNILNRIRGGGFVERHFGGNDNLPGGPGAGPAV